MIHILSNFCIAEHACICSTGLYWALTLSEIVSGARDTLVNKVPMLMEFIVCLEETGSKQNCWFSSYEGNKHVVIDWEVASIKMMFRVWWRLTESWWTSHTNSQRKKGKRLPDRGTSSCKIPEVGWERAWWAREPGKSQRLDQRVTVISQNRGLWAMTCIPNCTRR